MRGELDAADQLRRVLLAIAGDPGIRLRDIAATLGITEHRPRHRHRPGQRRLRDQAQGRPPQPHQIQAHLLLPGPASQQPAVGGLLDLLTSQRETTEHS